MKIAPNTAFQLLKGDFSRLKRLGDMKKLAAFVESPRYNELHGLLSPKQKFDLQDHFSAAKSAAQKRQKKLKPIPRYSQRGWRTWTPERIAKLKAAERKHGSDEGIARELGISLTAARMARWRHIGPRGRQLFVPYATAA